MHNFNSANWLIQLKRLAAICLLAALFLPLTQCTQTTQATKREPTQLNAAQSQQAAPDQAQVYASTADRNSTTLTVANVLLFIWPMCFILLTWLRPQLDERFYLRHLEIFLCLFSLIFLLRLTAFGTLLSGGYLAWSALLVYSLITLLRLLSRTHQVWTR